MLKSILYLFSLLALLISPAFAEEKSETKVYSVRMDEVFIGKLTFTHEIVDDQYRVSLFGETVGFAKALTLATLDGVVVGTGEEYRQYLPTLSVMDIQTPDYQNQIKLNFTENRLTEFESSAGEVSEIDLNLYEDIVDPITAFTYMARSQTVDKLCDKRVMVTDGRHNYRLVLLEKDRRPDGRYECKGGVERMEGFTEEELEERANYEFTAVYRQDKENEFRLDWLVTETIFGSVDVAFHY